MGRRRPPKGARRLTSRCSGPRTAAAIYATIQGRSGGAGPLSLVVSLMRYEAALTYSEPLVRYAVARFWWRVVGLRFVLAALLLGVCLALQLRSGDTSWQVGAVGVVLALSVVFPVAVYFVHYRNSLHKLRAMGNPYASFVATDDTLSISSGAGLRYASLVVRHRGVAIPGVLAATFLKSSIRHIAIGGNHPRGAQFHSSAASKQLAARAPNYALKRTVREEVSGAIMRCGPHGRLA